MADDKEHRGKGNRTHWKPIVDQFLRDRSAIERFLVEQDNVIILQDRALIRHAGNNVLGRTFPYGELMGAGFVEMPEPSAKLAKALKQSNQAMRKMIADRYPHLASEMPRAGQTPHERGRS